MKTKIWLSAISLILIASVLGSIFYYVSFAEPSQPNPSDSPSTPNDNLKLNNLLALPNGLVSFNVTLDDQESGIIESVFVNGEYYSWEDGSQEEPTIQKNETKEWTIDVGAFEEDHEVQVVIESSTGSASANATVASPTPSGNTSKEPEPTDTTVNPETPDNQTLPDYIYDYYGGVDLFTEGIHVIATEQDPRNLLGDFNVVNDFWRMFLEHETNQPSDQEFISILLSRGDKSTGGYTIQIENFAWIESYPVRFRFQVNFTDPGEGIGVTEALTNPLVLVLLGKLTPGEYHIEVPITQYILNIDKDGNQYYTQILTFAPIIWRQTLTIIRTEDTTPSTNFEVILNGNKAPDLTIQVDLKDGVTEEEAKKIAEMAFSRTMGDKLHRLKNISYDSEQITAHYTWGYNEDDMGHIFEVTADLTSLEITITHCR